MGIFKNFENWINEVTTSKNIESTTEFNERKYDYVQMNNNNNNGYYMELKTWAELTEEFGLNKFGNIETGTTLSYTKSMHKDSCNSLIYMNKDCIKTNSKGEYYIEINSGSVLLKLLKPASKLKVIDYMNKYLEGLNELGRYKGLKNITSGLDTFIPNIGDAIYLNGKTKEQKIKYLTPNVVGINMCVEASNKSLEALDNYFEITKEYKIENIILEGQLLFNEDLIDLLNRATELEKEINRIGKLVNNKMKLYEESMWIDDAIRHYELLNERDIIKSHINYLLDVNNFNDTIKQAYFMGNITSEELLNMIEMRI